MKTLTMIARHGIKKDNSTQANVTSYTLITPDYQTVEMKVDELKKAISGKAITVTNMDIVNGALHTTNGSENNYTLIDTASGYVVGQAKAVILDRVEQNNKLVGYTIFLPNGTINETSVIDAVGLVNKKLVSNGKIRHTSEGDIVSAIGGNYPLRAVNPASAPKGEITVNLLYIASVANAPSAHEYFGAIISSTSAVTMSKLYNKLSESNAKVIAKSVKIAGQSVRKSLTIKRMGANSLYGVFEIADLKALAGKGETKVKCVNDKLIISLLTYDKDGEASEATVDVDKNWNISSGADKSSALTFANKVTSELKSIKLN